MAEYVKTALVEGPEGITVALLYGDFSIFDYSPSFEEEYNLFLEFSKSEKRNPGRVVGVVEDSERLAVWPPSGLLTTLVTYEVVYE